jgi:hypothetical protein
MGRVNGQNISIGIIANQGIYSSPLYVLREGRAGIEKVDFFPKLHTCTDKDCRHPSPPLEAALAGRITMDKQTTLYMDEH